MFEDIKLSWVGVEGPVDEGPVDEGPVDEGPVDEGPVDEGPVDEGPVDEGPVDEGPVDEGPVVLEVSSSPIINIAAEELEHTTHKPSKPMMATCDILLYIQVLFQNI